MSDSRLSSHLAPTRPAVPAVFHSRSLLHALSLWSSVGEAGRSTSTSLPIRTVCSVFWLGLPLGPVDQRLLSLWADHLNVGSLRGWLVGPSRGPPLSHLLPSVFLLLGCPHCSGRLLLRVPEGWPSNPAPSRGPLHPRETRILAVTPWWRAAPPGLSAPVFTSSRDIRSLLG